MRILKRIAFLLLVLTALAVAAPCHPLGNFSVNQYSRIEVGKSAINIRQVLDMAEIPTYQESARIDTDKDGKLSTAELEDYFTRFSPGYVGNLRLDVDRHPVDLTLISHQIRVEPGAGDLSIMKVYLDLSGVVSASDRVSQASFRNLNFNDRVGWDEIVIKRSPGIGVFDSTAFGSAVTDELKSYPQDSLAAPLAERSAQFSFIQGADPTGTKPLVDRDGVASTVIQRDRFAELISVPEITPSVIIVGLLLAFGLGAMHALSPGHGKTVVGAYLVGSKGTPKHAAFLGLTVTITHTLGVFALGLVTLFASNYILPERLMPILSFFSGALVLMIGLSMFKKRLLGALGGQTEHVHYHRDDDGNLIEHSHGGHTHSHGGHEHTHEPPDKLTWRGLLALGISGGLLPCPSALVLMLAAISLGRIGYGLVLTLAFSLGLAATLTSVGLAFLYIGKLFERRDLSRNWLAKTVPVFSSLIIAVLGGIICYNSIG